MSVGIWRGLDPPFFTVRGRMMDDSVSLVLFRPVANLFIFLRFSYTHYSGICIVSKINTFPQCHWIVTENANLVYKDLKKKRIFSVSKNLFDILIDLKSCKLGR